MESPMLFTIGLTEVVTFAGALIAAGWILISMSFTQFEKRLDEKLATLDSAVSEIKRLEIEIVRSDARAAQTYATKLDNEKALERIFNVLERVELSLNTKISREEVQKMVDSFKH